MQGWKKESRNEKSKIKGRKDVNLSRIKTLKSRLH